MSAARRWLVVLPEAVAITSGLAIFPVLTVRAFATTLCIATADTRAATDTTTAIPIATTGTTCTPLSRCPSAAANPSAILCHRPGSNRADPDDGRRTEAASINSDFSDVQFSEDASSAFVAQTLRVHLFEALKVLLRSHSRCCWPPTLFAEPSQPESQGQ